MRILFCDSGFSPKEVDYMFAEEFAAAKAAGHPCSLMNFEKFKAGQIEKALQRVSPAPFPKPILYRGWMLKPEQYQRLYEGLQAKGWELLNSPEAYRFCHYLPESYELIKDYTAKSTYLPIGADFQIQKAKELLIPFENKAVIIKDYVKSQKHYWEEACYIPNASDWEQAKKVIQRFLELQDADLNEGLVVREFVPLQKLGQHSRSGMPLTKEFRLFVLDHQLMSSFEYWTEATYKNAKADWTTFEELLPQIPSRFFSLDIAQKEDGNWIIVELGDGQVSGLHEGVDLEKFYKNLQF